MGVPLDPDIGESDLEELLSLQNGCGVYMASPRTPVLQTIFNRAFNIVRRV